LQLPEYLNFVRATAIQSPALSVIIPAFNEASRIAQYIESIHAYLAERKEGFEIIVVDDGSRDQTSATVRALFSSFPALALLSYKENRGKGHAVRMGMQAAGGALRLFADADGSTPIAELERLRSCMQKEGADIAIASRDVRDVSTEIVNRSHRRFIGQTFRRLREWIVPIGVQDSQCGFKLFTASAAETVFPDSCIDGFAFDVEILYRARRAGLKIVEVPVNWTNSSMSQVNLLTTPVKMFFDLFQIRRAINQKPKN